MIPHPLPLFYGIFSKGSPEGLSQGCHYPQYLKSSQNLGKKTRNSSLLGTKLQNFVMVSQPFQPIKKWVWGFYGTEKHLLMNGSDDFFSLLALWEEPKIPYFTYKILNIKMVMEYGSGMKRRLIKRYNQRPNSKRHQPPHQSRQRQLIDTDMILINQTDKDRGPRP